jgi:hypothetical protein
MAAFGRQAVPTLIFCLKSKNNNITSAAEAALTEITGKKYLKSYQNLYTSS